MEGCTEWRREAEDGNGSRLVFFLILSSTSARVANRSDLRFISFFPFCSFVRTFPFSFPFPIFFPDLSLLSLQLPPTLVCRPRRLHLSGFD